MTELEKHRKNWQGKTDEWLFNRLANELKDKVEEIHKLLAENEQLILSGVSQQREQFADLLIWYKYNVGRDNIKNCKELAEEYINL